MRRLAVRRLLLCLLAAALLAVPSQDAAASPPIAGALDAPGERSHSVTLGWPEFTYTWEPLVRERVAAGVRVGVQIWPLALSVGANLRFKITERGPVSLSLLVAPGVGVAGYGGSKAIYLQNYQFGRSRVFRASVGPQLNVGLLASIEVSEKLKIMASFENPVSMWVWTRPTAWWVEWPIVLTGGAEYRISYNWSLFGRLGAGPTIAFAGNSQLLGIHWHILAGAQIRY
ncbi:MAG: hypothetical protein KDA24_19355 [Deltaproteobacteria bacterium]|nr:hypothetical protein [Deltaproteobacteria bacterium]